MAVILHEPSSILFSGNIPDIEVLSNDAEVQVTVYKNGLLFINETYNPFNRKFEIVLKHIIHNQLKGTIPSTGSDYVEQTSCAFFEVNIIDSQPISFSFTAIKGGIDGTVDASVFLSSNWLTWQPLSKSIQKNKPEWLTLYTIQAVIVKAKAYYQTTSETISLASLPIGKLFSVDVSYSHLLSKFQNDPLSIDVWFESNSGTILSRFIFENSLSGFDTIKFTGLHSENEEQVLYSALIKEETFNYDFDFNRIHTKYTGYFSSTPDRIWIEDFFHSLQRFHFDNNQSIKPIAISKPKLEFIKGQLNGYSFQFAHSKQSKFFNHVRN